MGLLITNESGIYCTVTHETSESLSLTIHIVTRFPDKQVSIQVRTGVREASLGLVHTQTYQDQEGSRFQWKLVPAGAK